MTQESINNLILKLDQQHQDAITQRETATGSNAEIFANVNRNILDNQKYMNERKSLVKILNDITPVSKGVEDFLLPTKIESKFDVENGIAKIDNSLQIEGRQIGKKI